MTTILVIEDEAPIREEVVDILSFEGFDVIEAANGAAGLALARQQHPDLILSDIMMPEMDGFDVLRQLQNDRPLASVPFIFITAKTAKADLRQGMLLGADDYLTKPFTRDELLGAVQSRLTKHAVIQEEVEQSLDNLRQAVISHLPHELRTPLISILGYGGLLQEAADSFSSEEITAMGNSIVDSGQRLQRLIENYLMFANLQVIATDSTKRIALGKAINKTPGDTIKLVAKQVATNHERVANLTLDTINIPVAMADEFLHKLIYELVDNAFKFSEPGTPVSITTRLDDHALIIAVSGTGRGIQPEQIAAIDACIQFERGYYEQQGLGLGLVIAQKIAELHGGRLDINSIPGQVTTVSVTLCQAAQPQPEI